MKIQKKKKIFFFFWGGGGGGVGLGSGWLELRSEAFVKIPKKKKFRRGRVGGVGGRIGGVRVDVNGEVKLL